MTCFCCILFRSSLLAKISLDLALKKLFRFESEQIEDGDDLSLVVPGTEIDRFWKATEGEFIEFKEENLLDLFVTDEELEWFEIFLCATVLACAANVVLCTPPRAKDSCDVR